MVIEQQGWFEEFSRADLSDSFVKYFDRPWTRRNFCRGVENVSSIEIRVEIYRSYRESFRLEFVTGTITKGTKERRKMGRFLHTAVSFQFHENSTGILLFHAKLANTAAVYKRLHSCAMKTRWNRGEFSNRSAAPLCAARTVCLTGLLSMQNERKLRVIEDTFVWKDINLESNGGGGSFFVINHWNVQWKFLLGVAFLSRLSPGCPRFAKEHTSGYE